MAYDHHPGFGLVPFEEPESIIITTMNKPAIMYSLLIGNLIRKVMAVSVFKTMGYKNVNWISIGQRKPRKGKWLNELENKFSNSINQILFKMKPNRNYITPFILGIFDRRYFRLLMFFHLLDGYTSGSRNTGLFCGVVLFTLSLIGKH